MAAKDFFIRYVFVVMIVIIYTERRTIATKLPFSFLSSFAFSYQILAISFLLFNFIVPSFLPCFACLLLCSFVVASLLQELQAASIAHPILLLSIYFSPRHTPNRSENSGDKLNETEGFPLSKPAAGFGFHFVAALSVSSSVQLGVLVPGRPLLVP